MNASDWRIAPLSAREIDAVRTLAQEVWREHYPPIIGEAQTEYMLAQRYAPEVIASELGEAQIWWDILRSGAQLVAFSACCLIDAHRLKIDKLYVRADHRRQGCAGALIDNAARRAQAVGATRIELAVNKRNTQAIAAYRKHGFDIRDAVVKDIGSGFVMDDYIMERTV